jgi:hypothetical protein
MWSESTKQDTVFETLMRPAIRRGIIAAALAGMIAPGLAGCYGSFPITNAIYEFNGKVTKSRFVHSIVMIVLFFLAVYGITILVDAIIFNLVEFWTGKDIETSQVFEQPDGTVVVLAPGGSPNELVMTIMREGDIIERRHFLRGEDGLVSVSDGAGATIGSVRPTTDGGFDLIDNRGSLSNHISSQDIASLRNAQPAF